MENIKNIAKKYVFAIGIIISIVLILVITCSLKTTKKVIAKVEEKQITKKKEETLYKIDIKGAVVNPGVYTLTDNSRVIDVINLAGGVLENADTSLINLAKRLEDEMVIIIYTKDEIAKYNEGQIKTEYVYIEVNNCPDVINDACILEKEENNQDTEENTSLVNINNASKEQLQKLPGIGESKAISIVEYRENTSKFNNIEDIKNVSGIGDSLFEKIKENITV